MIIFDATLYTEFRLSIGIILFLAKKKLLVLFDSTKIKFSNSIPNDSNPLVPRKLEIMN